MMFRGGLVLAVTLGVLLGAVYVSGQKGTPVSIVAIATVQSDSVTIEWDFQNSVNAHALKTMNVLLLAASEETPTKWTKIDERGLRAPIPIEGMVVFDDLYDESDYQVLVSGTTDGEDFCSPLHGPLCEVSAKDPLCCRCKKNTMLVVNSSAAESLVCAEPPPNCAESDCVPHSCQVGGGTCACVSGFWGDGTFCVPFSDTDYTVVSLTSPPLTFTTLAIDPCGNFSCGEAGTCISAGGRPFCKCDSSMSGPKCDIPKRNSFKTGVAPVTSGYLIVFSAFIVIGAIASVVWYRRRATAQPYSRVVLDNAALVLEDIDM